MVIQIKRVYEKPAARDGTRILVDRLWPRGLTKEVAVLLPMALFVVDCFVLRHSSLWQRIKRFFARLFGRG